MKPAAQDSASKRAIIYADDELFRYGLHAYLKQEFSDFEFEEADSPAVEERLSRFDLLVLDIVVAGAFTLQLIERARAKHDRLGILVVGRQAEEACAERCLLAGANGFLNSCSPIIELKKAVDCVLSNEIYISQTLQNRLLRGEQKMNPIGRLTAREFDVFFMLGLGRSTKEIARELELSVKTIETYREKIKQKLGFTTSQKLTRYALEANVFHFHTAHSLKQNRTREEHQKG